MDCRRIFRLLFACVFLLAIAKFLLRTQRRDNTRNPKPVRIPSDFWIPEKKPDFSNTQITESLDIHATLEVQSTLKAPERKHTGPFRVVHLDLKGAPPKVSYLQQLFPLISSLGADGILMEYEDMFPYEGELKVLRSPFAYSVEDIKIINTLASTHNLELIPLVQVFGHLEFVLKHENFFNLREVANFPNSLNPLAPGSIKLVKEMLIQVLKKHPLTRWFHIGADEVWGLGESEESKNWLKENNSSIKALFLSHVTKVCNFLVELKPGIKPIFWEDMLRKIDVDLIKESSLPQLASPVLWNYNSNMNLTYIGKLLSNYQKAGFLHVWFASAFKGASGIDQRWTPLKQHLGNHQAWLKVMDSMSKYHPMKLDGIALTGWQRYEHHTVLCELFPVAIPSLAICLETLKHGSFNSNAETAVEKMLGCKVDIKASICKGNGTFPGSEIYYMIHKIHNELQNSWEQLSRNAYLRGSFSPYQRKYNFANPRNLARFKFILTSSVNEWDRVMEKFRMEMIMIYFSDTVEEWMMENVNEYLDKFHKLAKDTERVDKRKGRPKSLKG